MRVCEALAAGLAAEGVEVVFGLLAGDNDSLIYELVQKYRIRFVAARHEHAAVGMAEGYSRLSGKIGVAIVTLRPGLTEGSTFSAGRRRTRPPGSWPASAPQHAASVPPG